MQKQIQMAFANQLVGAPADADVRLMFLGENPGVDLQVYSTKSSELATLHEQWDVIEIPARGQLPRLRKKVA